MHCYKEWDTPEVYGLKLIPILFPEGHHRWRPLTCRLWAGWRRVSARHSIFFPKGLEPRHDDHDGAVNGALWASHRVFILPPRYRRRQVRRTRWRSPWHATSSADSYGSRCRPASRRGVCGMWVGALIGIPRTSNFVRSESQRTMV